MSVRGGPLYKVADVSACVCMCPRLQIDWFEVYLRAQEERGFEGSFRTFLDLQVRNKASWHAADQPRQLQLQLGVACTSCSGTQQ